MKVFYTEGYGLGDHLLFSTLPEKFNEIGQEVFFHSSNRFRNQMMKELILDCNPFIKGISEQPANIGQRLYLDNGNYFAQIKNMIMRVEASNGLVPTNIYPKIYYRFDKNNPSTYKERIFIDDMAVSTIVNNVYNNKKLIIETIRKILSNSINEKREVFLIRAPFANSIQSINLDILGFPTIQIKDSFEYCDLIKNCFHFICLSSGSQVLASAIKRENIFPLITVIDSNPHLQNCIDEGVFVFDNVSYINYNL